MRDILRIVAALTFGLVSWFASGSALAQPACNASPSDAERSQALEAMGAGVAFIRDPEQKSYEDAYPQFKKAYELTCSINALQNLALCEMNLELDGDAIVHYEEVLAKKTDLAEDDRRQIESDVARLKATVAWITFSADRESVSLVDTRTPNRGANVQNTYALGMAPKKLGIHPGRHSFVASAEGLSVTWDVEIKPGDQLSHAFDFAAAAKGQPQPDPQPITPGDSGGGLNIPVYVWVTGGVTVASAIVMAVMMGVSSAKKSEYEDEVLGKASVSEQEDAVSEIQTFSAVADVFIGVTIAAAATTVILALTAPSGDSANGKKNGPKFGVDYTVAPMIDDQGGGASVTVRF